jgi:hypothetical protein
MKHAILATLAMATVFAATEARADVYFCGQGIVNVQSASPNEVGMVISQATSPTSPSTIVAKMDNFYGKGAGGYWTSGLGQQTLSGGTSCWILAASSKQSNPSGASKWACDYPTITSILPNGFTVSFTDPSTFQVVQFASFSGQSFDAKTLSSSTGGPNCPPPGQ